MEERRSAAAQCGSCSAAFKLLFKLQNLSCSCETATQTAIAPYHTSAITNATAAPSIHPTAEVIVAASGHY